MSGVFDHAVLLGYVVGNSGSKRRNLDELEGERVSDHKKVPLWSNWVFVLFNV